MSGKIEWIGKFPKSPKEDQAEILRLLKQCKENTKPYWKVEFEDEIVMTIDSLHLKNYEKYQKMFEKYFGVCKVRVKIRKDCIQIERIK